MPEASVGPAWIHSCSQALGSRRADTGRRMGEVGWTSWHVADITEIERPNRHRTRDRLVGAGCCHAAVSCLGILWWAIPSQTPSWHAAINRRQHKVELNVGRGWAGIAWWYRSGWPTSPPHRCMTTLFHPGPPSTTPHAMGGWAGLVCRLQASPTANGHGRNRLAVSHRPNLTSSFLNVDTTGQATSPFQAHDIQACNVGS